MHKYDALTSCGTSFGVFLIIMQSDPFDFPTETASYCVLVCTSVYYCVLVCTSGFVSEMDVVRLENHIVLQTESL